MSESQDKMIAQFKTLEELQAFAKAQQKTLIDQQKKLREAQDKVKHLEKLLEGAVPVINAPAKIDPNSQDEEQIARQQLFLLKAKSNDGELSLEETKRVEIYSKILMNLKQKEKDIEVPSRNLSNQELIATLQNTSEDDGSDKQH